MSTYLSVSELNQLSMAFQPLRCWRFGKYLGSMLTLDFGDTIEVATQDQTSIEEGSLKIGIRNVLWVAKDGGRTIVDAERVNDDLFAAELALRPIGAALSTITSAGDDRWIAFSFSNGFVLSVDATNAWKTQSDLLEMTFPDGRIVVVDEDGAIELLDEVEPIRSGRWRARLV